MKKLVSLALALVMLLALVACTKTAAPATETKTETTEAKTETTTASSGDFPTKPITLLCGYSAGGSSDLGCRYLAEALREELGQPVVVENVPGSGSWLAWNQLLQTTDLSLEEISEQCGFTNLLTFRRNFKASMGINPSDYRKT